MDFWTNRINNFNKDLNNLEFKAPVNFVYNPLEYAKENYLEYLRKYGQGKKKTVFLGMNPGPWGMVQTGIPFGEIEIVKTWLKLDKSIQKPSRQHPKRPIMGLSCRRREISGKRLWHWIKSRWKEPGEFFSEHFVANYCPLAFLEKGGRNRTPNRLKKTEREQLFHICDKFLLELIEKMEPEYVFGIGKFAVKRAEKALEGKNVKISYLHHPSPANPVANRGWAKLAEKALEEVDYFRNSKN
ncbi:MAG: uracil-DNA glycosylase family protein [Myxococcota bacterium]